MPEASFAVISDLHCRLKDDDDDSYLTVGSLRSPSKRHPVQSLIDLIAKEDIRVDTLLVPGDLTNRARLEGLSQGWDYSLEIGQHLRATTTIPVIGNHDIDSRRSNPALPVFHDVRNLRPGFPYPTEFLNQSYFSDGYCVIHTPTADILALNTVIDHTDPASAARGTFGVDRIERMEAALEGQLTNPLKVALLHHHPLLHNGPFFTDNDVLPTGDRLLDAFDRLGIRLVVHGHKHMARLSRHNSTTILGSGSFSAKVFQFAPTAMRNTFHVIGLEGDGPHNVRGQIYTWAYFYNMGWQRADDMYTGFPYQAGFGRTTGIQQIAASLISMSEVAPDKDRFLESEVLSMSPELELLIPQEQEELNLLLSRRNLKLTRQMGGRLEMWKEYQP
jgi:3',5'-cyclic AMP phosphodiesterase CpdA